LNYDPLQITVHARLLGHSVLFVRPAGQNRRCFKDPSCALARPSENRSVWTRPRSHVPVFDRPGADRTGESTTWNFITSAVLTGRWKEQAVVHAQW